MTIPFTMSNESITIVWEGKTHTVSKGSPQFLALKQAIISENWDDIPKNLTVVGRLETWAKGFFTIEGRVVKYKGESIPTSLTDRITKMATNNEDPTPLFKFWERLQKNPSFRSVEQLWPFLAQRGIPITEDGYFLAYKAVNSQSKDFHTRTVDNSVGVTNEMPRNKISDDPKLNCHDGFHVGAIEYAQNFGGTDRRIIICKVDPENVVCVPYDCSQQKMRVCKYTVVGHWNGEHMPGTTIAKADVPDQSDEKEVCPDCDEEDCVCCDEYGDDTDIPEEMPTESHGAQDDPESSVCEECGNTIPDNDREGRSGINAYHKESCSLHPNSQVPMEKKSMVLRVEKRKPNKGWASYDKRDMAGLMECSIEDLRQYAGKGLSITGASKIPGGKTALIAKILEVRA